MIELVPEGSPRALPERVLGFNTPVCYDVPHEDPHFTGLVRDLAPAILRFPGGTVANFWDWREGHLSVPVVQGASQYREFLNRIEPRTRQRHPEGCSTQRFQALCGEIGAEMLLVTNLETDTAESQAEWIASMPEKPRFVEMGNEFFLHMLNDAESRRRFPDWETTLRITKEYVDTISLPQGTKIAVQAAGSRFYDAGVVPGGLAGHMWEWDDRMEPHDWFDAVTIHLYPRGDDAAKLVALSDEGTRRVVEHVSERMPGKEIWVTEWGTGVTGAVIRGQRTTFTGYWLHTVARMLLAMLREPAITMATYHALFFDGSSYAVYRRSSGQFVPIGPHTLLRWFHDAAAGGAKHQRLVAPGVEAARFGEVVIAHNASGEETTIALRGTAEVMRADPGEDLSRGLPAVSPPADVDAVTMPPWSIARIRRSE